MNENNALGVVNSFAHSGLQVHPNNAGGFFILG